MSEWFLPKVDFSKYFQSIVNMDRLIRFIHITNKNCGQAHATVTGTVGTVPVDTGGYDSEAWGYSIVSRDKIHITGAENGIDNHNVWY